MAGKRRPMQHAGVAWRQQQALAALEAALFEMPDHDTVVMQMQAQVHAVCGLMANATAAAATTAGPAVGSGGGPVAADEASVPDAADQAACSAAAGTRGSASSGDSLDAAVAAASRHLRRALDAAGAAASEFAASLLAWYLLLAVDHPAVQQRYYRRHGKTQHEESGCGLVWADSSASGDLGPEVDNSSGGRRDELALCSTWRLAPAAFARLLCAMGWQGWLLEALAWIPAVVGQVDSRKCPVTAASSAAVSAGTAAAAAAPEAPEAASATGPGADADGACGIGGGSSSSGPLAALRHLLAGGPGANRASCAAVWLVADCVASYPPLARDLLAALRPGLDMGGLSPVHDAGDACADPSVQALDPAAVALVHTLAATVKTGAGDMVEGDRAAAGSCQQLGAFITLCRALCFALQRAQLAAATASARAAGLPAAADAAAVAAVRELATDAAAALEAALLHWQEGVLAASSSSDLSGGTADGGCRVAAAATGCGLHDVLGWLQRVQQQLDACMQQQAAPGSSGPVLPMMQVIQLKCRIALFAAAAQPHAAAAAAAAAAGADTLVRCAFLTTPHFSLLAAGATAGSDQASDGEKDGGASGALLAVGGDSSLDAVVADPLAVQTPAVSELAATASGAAPAPMPWQQCVTNRVLWPTLMRLPHTMLQDQLQEPSQQGLSSVSGQQAGSGSFADAAGISAVLQQGQGEQAAREAAAAGAGAASGEAPEADADAVALDLQDREATCANGDTGAAPAAPATPPSVASRATAPDQTDASPHQTDAAPAAAAAACGAEAPAAQFTPPAALPWQQQRLAGMACALLTPGVVRAWPVLARRDVCEAGGANAFSPFRMALALVEMAAQALDSFDAPSSVAGLRLRPQLLPVLVNMAAACCAGVGAGQQQRALQQAALGAPHLGRLRQVLLHEGGPYAPSASRALVAVSNRMVARAAHAGGVARGSAQEAQQAAAAAKELLPAAVLAPLALLRRLVADAVHHPGQLPLVLELLLAFKPAADWRQPAAPDGAASGCALLVQVLREVLLDAREIRSMSDAERRALLALLQGLAAADAAPAAAAAAAGAALCSRAELVSQLLVPVLSAVGPRVRCCLEGASQQVRTVLAALTALLATAPTSTTAAAPAPSASSTSSSPQSASAAAAVAGAARALFELLLMGGSSASSDGAATGGGAAIVGDLALGLCGLMQALEDSYSQLGALDVACMQQASQLLELLVSALADLSAALLPRQRQQQQQPQQATAGAAAALKDALGRVHSGVCGGDRRRLMAVLPALEGYLAARQEAEEEEGEHGEGGQSPALPPVHRLLLPPAIWRPAARGSATAVAAAGRPALHDQVVEVLAFAASGPRHALLLLQNVSEDAAEEAADEEEAAGNEDSEEGVGAGLRSAAAAAAAVAAAVQAAQAALVGGADADSITAPQARNVAGVMQRALSRMQPQQLQLALASALAQLLPTASSDQAARLLQHVLPVLLMTYLRSGMEDWLAAGWQRQRRQQQQDGDGPRADVDAAAARCLGSSLPYCAAAATVHLMREAITAARAAAQADAAPAGAEAATAAGAAASERCLQHLGAHVQVLLQRQLPGSGRAAAADTAAGSSGTPGACNAWAVSWASLHELMACRAALTAADAAAADAAGGAAALQVMALSLLPATCAPPALSAPPGQPLSQVMSAVSGLTFDQVARAHRAVLSDEGCGGDQALLLAALRCFEGLAQQQGWAADVEELLL